MRRPVRLVAVLAAIGLSAGLSPATARAQSVAVGEIGPSVLAGARGNIAVNHSAGIGNAQSNQAAIATGARQADAEALAVQQAGRHGPAWQSVGRQEARIAAHAFEGAAGIVAVNQASGSGNAQANMAGLALAPVAEVTVDHLASVSAPRAAGTQSGKPAAPERVARTAVVADTAFAGAAGIVQVNQIAGSGNATVNAFAMSVGASPR